MTCSYKGCTRTAGHRGTYWTGDSRHTCPTHTPREFKEAPEERNAARLRMRELCEELSHND